QLDGAGGRLELALDRGERGQVEVDRQRPEGHHRPEDQDQPGPGQPVGRRGQRPALDRSRAVAALPSAWPLEACITLPMKKPVSLPRALSSPVRNASHSSGWAATTPSTMASRAPVSSASKPFALAMAAGACPLVTISA